MGSMFDNYESINKNYKPNNLSSAFPKPNPINDKLTPAQLKKPYEQYNEKGDLIGYYWYYGDTLDLEFNLSGEVALDSSIMLYTTKNQRPNESTKGSIDTNGILPHFIYNVVDNIWYKCTQIDIENETYTWEQTIEPSDLVGGTRNVYFDIEDYLRDKKAKVNIYNFRNELIFTKDYPEDENGILNTQIVFPITQEISQKMTRNTYQCSLIIYNDETNYINTLFSQYDCVLTVK